MVLKYSVESLKFKGALGGAVGIGLREWRMN
jgi:hypothetical protein